MEAGTTRDGAISTDNRDSIATTTEDEGTTKTRDRTMVLRTTVTSVADTTKEAMIAITTPTIRLTIKSTMMRIMTMGTKTRKRGRKISLGKKLWKIMKQISKRQKMVLKQQKRPKKILKPLLQTQKLQSTSLQSRTKEQWQMIALVRKKIPRNFRRKIHKK